MRHVKTAIFLIAFITTVNGQKDLFRLDIDSLSLVHKTGEDIDSLDLYFTNHVSTLPGGAFNQKESILEADLFAHHPGGLNFLATKSNSKMLYAGLPHMGFGYSFGSLGTQFVYAEYQHALSSKLLLNINYLTSKGNGYLRNSGFDRHNVDVALLRKANRYSFLGQLKFTPQNINHSGGVVSDEGIDEFGLAFVNVRKGNARTTLREFSGGIQNTFRLFGDSTKAVYFFIDEEVGVRNRKYTEVTSDLITIYGVTNYDSDTTADQSQISTYLNTDGLELRLRNLQTRLGVRSKYWQYSNLNHPLDTFEFGVMGKLNFSAREFFKFELDADYNLIGAANEYEVKGKLNYATNGIDVQMNVLTSQKLPEAYRRSYYSNHFYSKLANLEKQGTNEINLMAAYSIGRYLDLKAEIDYTQLQNHYFFMGETWVNDSLPKIETLQLKSSVAAHFGPIHLYSNSSFVQGWEYSPSVYTSARLLFKNKIFKDKKLLIFFGVDGSYCSSYSLMTYLPILDVYSYGATIGVSDARTNLHAFFGFEAGQFRFFGRVENLGYFWNEKSIMVVNGYPVTGTNIRLGITWDFFN